MLQMSFRCTSDAVTNRKQNGQNNYRINAFGSRAQSSALQLIAQPAHQHCMQPDEKPFVHCNTSGK
eukprot:scaffold24053_cov84-Skeletonema_dohrnii-CCMP3373.AAC.3